MASEGGQGSQPKHDQRQRRASHARDAAAGAPLPGADGDDDTGAGAPRQPVAAAQRMRLAKKVLKVQGNATRTQDGGNAGSGSLGQGESQHGVARPVSERERAAAVAGCDCPPPEHVIELWIRQEI